MHDGSRSSTRSHQQQWQGTQRSHSGSSSQGTKRRADSDALDPPYESKRPRFSTQPAPRSQPQSDASRQNGSAKAEADSGAIPGSDLHGSTSGVIKAYLVLLNVAQWYRSGVNTYHGTRELPCMYLAQVTKVLQACCMIGGCEARVDTTCPPSLHGSVAPTPCSPLPMFPMPFSGACPPQELEM